MSNILSGPSVSEKILHNTNNSFSQYLVHVSKKHLNKIFMVDAESGDSVTFNDVLEKSYKIAVLLTQHGCSKNSVIGIICENRFEFPSLLLGGLHIGAICACINSSYSINEIQHAFSVSKPRIVFASSKTYEEVQNVKQNCNFIVKIIKIEEIDFNLLNKNLLTLNDTKIIPTDTAIILYSSGTTGLSKGVQLMHKSFIYLMELYRTGKIIKFPENNIVTGILPMSHSYGLFVNLLCLVLDHRYILIKRYTEKSFLSYIQQYKINTIYAVPPIAFFLAKDELVSTYDLNSVKLLSWGGASLCPEIENSLRKRLNCDVLQHYGMTETTAMTLYSTPDCKAGVTGKLLPGMQAKIIHLQNETTLGPFEKGEFCVRGPLLMKGYCEAENKTDPTDSEGWLHSGDVAYYDEQHNFYIIDRIKELIKYKAFQVPPAELELLILRLKNVKSVGVVGIPDEVCGELPRAYVVKKSEADDITEDDIINFVAENISSQKKLRGGVKFVSHLPQTLTGKINRKELKKWVTAEL